MPEVPRIRSEKGFSLLEVLVAIALISVVSAGFLGAMNNAQKGAMKTDQMDKARALAQDQMEYVKTLPFATSYSPGPTTVYDSVNNQFINYPGYSATITATPAAQRDANIQKITVAIIYITPDDRPATTTLDDCRVK